MRPSEQRCNTKASDFQPRAEQAKGTPSQEGLDRNRAEAGTGGRRIWALLSGNRRRSAPVVFFGTLDDVRLPENICKLNRRQAITRVLDRTSWRSTSTVWRKHQHGRALVFARPSTGYIRGYCASQLGSSDTEIFAVP